MLRIQCLEGILEGQTFEFDKNAVVLGRDPGCDLFLNDGACSRNHARLESTGTGYRVVDLKSTNGLQVNGRDVVEAELKYGDRVSIGRNLFLFATKVTPQDSLPDELEQESDACIHNTITIHDAERLFGSLGDVALDRVDPSGVVEQTNVDQEVLRKASQQMSIAYRVSKAINSTLNQESLLDLLVESILKNFEDVERVALFLAKEGKDHLVEEMSLVSESQKGIPQQPVSRAVLDKVKDERIGVLATDAATDARFESSESIALMDLRSFMCVPLISRDKVLGAIYAENSSVPGCFQTADLELLTVIGNQTAVAMENARLYRDMQVSFYETVKSLSNALEAKDKYTRGHSDRVARYAEAIGNNLDLPAERVQQLKTAAELHDIGKIAIDESIISKAGKLTDEEFEIMKQHPDLGVKILSPIKFLQPILPFIRHHHERYNGRGYPDALKGTDIPLEARILNLADAFDAMTTQRPYNNPKTFLEALAQCQKEAGVSFDADCVTAFAGYIEELVQVQPGACKETTMHGRDITLENDSAAISLQL